MMHPNVHCLIFDLDGTLSDTVPDIILAVNRMRAAFRLPELPPESVRRMIGNGFENLLMRGLEGTSVTPDMARETFHRTYRDSLNEAGTLFPGVYGGLHILKDAGYRIALLSNKPEPFCKTILEGFGLMKQFDAVFGGGTVYPLKPAPDAVWDILDIFGCEPENAWMIGDSVVDMQTGRNAGLKRGFVTWGYGTPGEETPDQTFRSFSELVLFLRNRLGKGS